MAASGCTSVRKRRSSRASARSTAPATTSATSSHLAICATCGVQFAEPSPSVCPICEDARQSVPQDGQQWTTLEGLRADRGNWITEDAGLVGIGTQPEFAIGQRALLVPYGDSNLLWECVSLLDAETAEEVERRGGLAGIAISHPHYYSSMVEWAQHFDCPVYLHADDREWVMRSDERIVHWTGETHDLGEGLTLVRCGGHFAGGQVLHSETLRTVFSGDIVQVIPDRAWVSFMYSYPNLIPLGEAAIRAIVAALEPFEFERIVGAWWGTVVGQVVGQGAEPDAKEIVARSAERYLRAIAGQQI